MSDWKRAMLLIEYDDGVQAVYEFTELTEAIFNRQLLPGRMAFVGNLRLSGVMTAVRAFPEHEELTPHRDAIETEATE